MCSSLPEALYELSIQQDLPPAPNVGPQCADWLPRFAGSSWLAYAASSAVVVATAASPLNPGESSSGRFFQQVLETCLSIDEANCEGRNLVTSVGWAPVGPSVGQLAAAAGKSIHLYSPTKLARAAITCPSFAEIPLAWETKQVLQHSFQVLTFSWTESGDGLLSAGSDIIMWTRGETGFSVLWQVQPTVPQAYAASSWSSTGLVATGDDTHGSQPKEGYVADDRIPNSSSGKATVWWWQEGQEIQGIELQHPSEVSMVQWRPSNGYGEDPYTYRPVLLTSSRDGSVRLWLDMEGPSYFSFCFGDSRELKKSPTFSVAVVVDVNTCLQGVLGHDIFVTWASESRTGGSSEEKRHTIRNNHVRRRDLAPCEWLVGVGPLGKVALWSIHSLDDILPNRSPRVTLWQQGDDVLAQPSTLNLFGEGADDATDRLMMKAVVQRPEGALAVPPASLDLFEALPSGHFRWSRLWPPISAIGTGGGHVGSGAQTGRNKSIWGVSSEVVHLDGHRGAVVQVALHPSPTVALAASVDDQGVILLWDLSAWSSPQVKVMSSQTLGWKLAGQISGLQNSTFSTYHHIAWAPSSFPEGRAILLAGDILKIDCFLVGRSDSQRKGATSVISDHMYSLHCPVFSEGDHLNAFNAIPMPLNAFQQVAEERSFLIIGIDKGGGVLASWVVQLQVTALSNSSQNDMVAPVSIQGGMERESEGGLCTSDSKFQYLEKLGYVLYTGSLTSQERIYIKDSLIGSVNFDGGQVVTSTAVVAGLIKGSLSTHLEVYEKAHPYDMLTGCADGSVRLYKVFCSQAPASPSVMSQTESSFWRCVGVVQAHSTPVIITATTGAGEKIASVGDAEYNKAVKIWEVDSCNENGDFEFEGQITLPQVIVALKWINAGMGCVLLAVATKFDLFIYVQDRRSSQKQISKSSVWSCLASFSFNTVIDHLLWSFQGSPILSSQGHIWVFSPWVCTKLGSNSGFGNINSSVGVPQPDSCNSCSLLQAAEVLVSPLADYHPRALFWSLFRGDKSQARACIRHLAHHLAANTIIPAARPNETLVSEIIDEDHIRIPRMGLAKLLQKDVSNTTQASANPDNTSFNFLSSTFTQSRPTNVSDKYSFLNNTSWLDEFSDELSEVKLLRSTQSQDVIKTGGSEPFSKTEMDAIIQFIEDGKSVLQLSKEELKQVIALVKVVGEMDGVNQAAKCAGLDLSGQRFWLAHRYKNLLASQSGGKKEDIQGIQVDSDALAWALQSDTKETLLDVCASEQSLWPELRALGVGFWFTDAVPLRKKMEKVARLQFMASRDAKDSALLYIALERRTMLAGLFKISKDERDRPLVDFMTRDFRDEKNQAAALKNAYVLMGKHRHELAAAFFLLGGDIDSAVSVCTKNLEDPQLGLVVCRLVEGSDGPIGRKLISKHVLPGAVRAGDYWLASLCQWLLGNGIETMHEVISGCQPSVSAQGMQEKTTELKRTSSSIPLDPGVADYCTVLVLKPRLLREPQREKVAAISKQATLRASLALRRIGLPLQALELMTASSGVKTITENGHHEGYPSSVGFNLNLMEQAASQDGSIGANWLLPELVADVQEVAKQNLALECISQLVQEYSNWAVAQQSSAHRLSSTHEGGKSSSSTEVESETAEEPEKKIEEGVEVLKNTFSLDSSTIVAGVVTWALNHHRLYMYYRLLLAQHAGFKCPEQKFSLSSGVGLPLRSDILGSIWKEAPWALARMILACGGSVFCLANSTSKQPTWKSMMPREQIEELVRYGGELQRLARLLSGYTDSTGNQPNEDLAHAGNEDLKKKTQRAMILLAFVYYVSAAWLGKNGKALIALVGPTISDPAKAPDVPKTNTSVKWFQDLCSQSNEDQNSLTRFAVSGDMGAVILPEEEVWRVTGVALWVHMVAYVKKQLAGTGKETSYSGFGRVSVQQTPPKSSTNLPSTNAVSPLQAPSTSSSSRLVATFMGLGIQSASSVSSTAWSEIKNKMRDDTQAAINSSSAPSDQDSIRVAESPRSSRNYGDLYLSLLSSLGCIATGLQQQLAAHLRYLLEVKGNSDPLVIWLWGKPSDSKIEDSISPKAGTSSNISAITGDGRQQLPIVYPEIQLGGDDESSKELWKLLVVRESVRSTLAMEGVLGPTSTTIRAEKGDWREARRRSALSAIEVDGYASTGSHAKVDDKALTAGATRNSEGFEGRYIPEFQKPEAMFSLSGELIEGFCINSYNPDQVVLATNRKGLMYLDLHTRGSFSVTSESMLEQGSWPRSSWAGAVATPGSSLKTQRSSSLSLGGSAAGATLKSGKESVKTGGVSFGMPGYGGMGAWGGWEDWEDVDSVVDPIATVDNVRTKALAAHPSQPIFLVGSNNTHVYLWEYGKPSATATYGVLPAANMPPPYVIPSVATVRFDSGGHRFVTAAMDGTVSMWQLEVGGRSNVRPTESCLFFGTHASTYRILNVDGGNLAPLSLPRGSCNGMHVKIRDATFVVGSTSLVAATGSTSTGKNLIAWDTLAPPSSNRQSISCHEGGARCIASLDLGVGGSSNSPWIVSGGKGGDVAVHDFRYILSQKGKRPQSPSASNFKNNADETGQNGMLWHVPKAHAGSVTKATAVPGTPYFFTGSKDGDIKLWDVSSRSMVGHWQKVHERHTFLQVNSRSLGSIIQQAAVTDIQPTVDGFLSCGGDGTVKLFRHL